MRDDQTHFLDMLIAARKIRQFTADLSQADFFQSQLHQSAIIRELQVIGEAARLVTDEGKASVTGIDWEQIAGMRNRLVHEYFRISLNIVWQTVQNDIEPLISELEKIVPSESE